MITEGDDPEKVTELAEKVLSQNDGKVTYSGGEVSVSVRCGAIKISEDLRFSVLCNDFNAVMEKTRYSGRFEFM